MKNSEEFRRLVFEKAKSYEIRRRARNKEIAGSVIVCSLVLALSLPISLHLYHQGANPTEDTTAETAASCETTAATMQTTTAYTTWETPEETKTGATTALETTATTARATSTTTATTSTEGTTTYDCTTTTYDIVPTQTTVATTAAEPTDLDSATRLFHVGDRLTVGAMPYEQFIEHYHGARVLSQTISGEDALLSYLESHAELYGGKIMDAMNLFNERFFREHDLLLVESPHRVRDITVENGEVIVVLGEVMSKNSVIQMIVIEKSSDFRIDSIWY